MSTAIHPSAFVDEAAQIGRDVTIGPGAVIGPHVRIGDGTSVGSHALITGWTKVGRGCTIHHGAVVGSAPQDLKYSGEAASYLEVGDHTVLREYTTLNLATEPGATTRVGSHCLLMAYAHVAHNCQLGDHVILANAVQLAGYVTIEDWAILGGGTMVHQFTRIGCHSMIGGMSRVTQDVAPYARLAGTPPRLVGVNTIGLERRGVPAATIAAIQRAYRTMFRAALRVPEAVAEIRAREPGVAEVEHLARFAETSARGLNR
jgi:UDP-N-acetylglucosamine acyltransferase